MNKKKIIVVSISALVIVIVLAVVGILNISKSPNIGDSKDNVSSNIENVNDNLNNNVSLDETQSITNVETNTSTSTTTTENVSISTSSPSSNEQTQFEERGNVYAFEDSLVLQNVNQEQATNKAIEFMRAFLTYNPETLRSGFYKSSWAGMVKIGDENGTLLQQHLNDLWNQNSSTYPEMYSLLTDIKVDTLYISHLTHNDAISVSMTCVVDANQGEPGEMEWEYVNTEKVNYAVYMNKDLQILDVRRQKAQTINFNIFNK